MPNNEIGSPVTGQDTTARILAGDYLNKISGEQIERECRRRLNDGCKRLILDFSKTELINSIGISILLGIIDSASTVGAEVVLSEVKEDTFQLFDMLGVTNHVSFQN